MLALAADAGSSAVLEISLLEEELFVFEVDEELPEELPAYLALEEVTASPSPAAR